MVAKLVANLLECDEEIATPLFVQYFMQVCFSMHELNNDFYYAADAEITDATRCGGTARTPCAWLTKANAYGPSSTPLQRIIFDRAAAAHANLRTSIIARPGRGALRIARRREGPCAPSAAQRLTLLFSCKATAGAIMRCS